MATSPGLSRALAHALRAARGSEALALADFRAITRRNVREQTFSRLLATTPERRRRWNNAFANLVSGRFTELVFEASFADPLAEVGVEIRDATTDRSFIDYELVATDPSEDFAISVNVKNAGRQMRDAQRFFGLAPEDTLPMATYKAFGAQAQGVAALLYVYLVDWTLERGRGDGHATPAERRVFALLTSFSGMPRDLEDDFIALTVEQRLPALRQAVGYQDLTGLPFHAISSARCHTIFYEQHERSPYVFVKRMDTDPNVHISVSLDTTPFELLIDYYLSTPEDRATLVAGLQQTKGMAIPDPPV